MRKLKVIFVVGVLFFSSAVTCQALLRAGTESASRAASINQKRDELKAKLAALKDRKKAKTTERVTERITNINSQRTNQMLKHLGVMEKILERVAGKSATLDPIKKAPVDRAIVVGRSAVATAKEAVEVQAEKEYIINVTTEIQLRAAVQAVINQFKADLKAVHQLVVAAKKATADAVNALALAVPRPPTPSISSGSGEAKSGTVGN